MIFHINELGESPFFQIILSVGLEDEMVMQAEEHELSKVLNGIAWSIVEFVDDGSIKKDSHLQLRNRNHEESLISIRDMCGVETNECIIARSDRNYLLMSNPLV